MSKLSTFPAVAENGMFGRYLVYVTIFLEIRLNAKPGTIDCMHRGRPERVKNIRVTYER
jgi:hypothetical protein